MEQQRAYKKTRRYTKRLEATFSSGPFTYRGILSDVSENGLFIRTSRGFVPGILVDIEIMMPGDQVCHLKGIVRRTIKTPLSSIKNGMGIELMEKDAVFTNFIKGYSEETVQEHSEGNKPEEEKISPPEFSILTCPACGVKNKVSHEKLLLDPKCGKCRTPLTGL